MKFDLRRGVIVEAVIPSGAVWRKKTEFYVCKWTLEFYFHFLIFLVQICSVLPQAFASECSTLQLQVLVLVHT